MEDRLIFPTSTEQVITGELIHCTFAMCDWTNIPYNGKSYISDTPYYISDIKLDIAPALFFEWAYTTPPVLFYCLNLSLQYMLEPTDWMRDVITRLGFAPRRLTDGK